MRIFRDISGNEKSKDFRYCFRFVIFLETIRWCQNDRIFGRFDKNANIFQKKTLQKGILFGLKVGPIGRQQELGAICGNKIHKKIENTRKI